MPEDCISRNEIHCSVVRRARQCTLHSIIIYIYYDMYSFHIEWKWQRALCGHRARKICKCKFDLTSLAQVTVGSYWRSGMSFFCVAILDVPIHQQWWQRRRVPHKLQHANQGGIVGTDECIALPNIYIQTKLCNSPNVRRWWRWHFFSSHIVISHSRFF